ncbi:MAG: Mannosyl-glycoprotein endo-beta-N-acetylglucosaminidase [Sporomusa sp.]|nr:Mannosyl-glycoprotein endo-beta-N-acetylglucosaminidase [Sporomusa sp.]
MIFLLFLLLLFPFPHPALGKDMPIELKTLSNIDLSIRGEPLATQEQCINYLRKKGRMPLLTVSIEQLVSYFYQESRLEGIRPDVAFAQAIHETGHFRYGGDVVPLQNNYCGLGTTGGGVKGAWFPNAQVGVRAQVQHLLAYTSTKPPELQTYCKIWTSAYLD